LDYDMVGVGGAHYIAAEPIEWSRRVLISTRIQGVSVGAAVTQRQIATVHEGDFASPHPAVELWILLA